jgi:hypothetical protein
MTDIKTIDHVTAFKKVVSMAIEQASASGVRDHEIIKYLRHRADGLVRPIQYISPMSENSLAQPELRAALQAKEEARLKREYEKSAIPKDRRQVAASGYRVR